MNASSDPNRDPWAAGKLTSRYDATQHPCTRFSLSRNCDLTEATSGISARGWLREMCSLLAYCYQGQRYTDFVTHYGMNFDSDLWLSVFRLCSRKRRCYFYRNGPRLFRSRLLLEASSSSPLFFLSSTAVLPRNLGTCV